MKILPLRPARAAAALAALLAGASCAHNSLYFGTKTSVGAEVSGTTTAPTQVSVSSSRSEVAMIPAKADGTTHSVFGRFDYDFSWTDGLALTQIFAAGDAAVAAAGNDHYTVETVDGALAVKRTRDSQTVAPGDNQQGKLFFATNTKFGLSLDLGQSIGQTVPSFLFGYRRDEATIVPIADASKEVNSVFADLSLVVDRGGKIRKNDATPAREPIAPDRLPASQDGSRIIQRFATGRAAILVATTNENRAKLAGTPVSPKDALDATTSEEQLRTKAAALTDEQRKPFVDELQRLHPGWTWEGFRDRHYPELLATDIAQLKAKLPSP